MDGIDLLTSTEQAVVATDLEGRITHFNRRAEQLYGWPATEVVGQPAASVLLPPRQLGRVQEIVRELVRGRVFAGEFPIVRRNGKELLAWMLAYPHRRDGAISGIVTIAMRSRRGSRALQKRKQDLRLRGLLRAIPDMVFRIRRDGVYTDFAGLEDGLLASPEAFLGRTVRELLPPATAALVEDAIARSFQTKAVTTIAYELDMGAGPQIFEARLAPIDDREVVTVVRDVTQHFLWRDELDNQVAERTVALQRANRKLNELSKQLLIAHDEERGRIASELHDHQAQLLTALSLSLENCRREVPESDRYIAMAQPIVDELTRQVRELSLALRPPDFGAIGLIGAVEEHIARFGQQTGMRISFWPYVSLQLPRAAEITAYRIIQESLTNAARARATHVVIQMKRAGDAIEITVDDNGRGFDPTTVDRSRTSGLTGMRERSLLAGGTFLVESSPGSGTRVLFTLPIMKEGDREQDDRDRG